VIAVPRLLSLLIFLISSMMAFYHYFAGNHYIGFVVICMLALFQIKINYGDDYE
tara:strand:- start:1525 stop:1686 length:162 start_codon:yes stop_codon:yes gene_type:complete